MHSRSKGNGNTKVYIDAIEKKPGYLIICPQTIAAVADQLPVYLSQTLEKWFVEHPSCRVRASVGIVMDGQTVALHVWYDDSST